MVNIDEPSDVIEIEDVGRRRHQKIKNSSNVLRWPMGNQNGRTGMFSTRLVSAILSGMIILIAGIAVGQEFRPDKDYIPNDYEKILIDRIKSAAKPDTSAMEFILRMPFAIETACKALTNPTAKAIDSIMGFAGGHHKVIFRETREKLLADSSVISETLAQIPAQGHFAVKTVELPKGAFLIVYWSDIAYTRSPTSGAFGYGGVPESGTQDYFSIRLSACTDTDSIKYTVYRGVSSIVIDPDSAVETKSFVTIHDSFDVSIEFEKKRFDIWTVNLYALDGTTKQYDLVSIVIPAVVVDRPPHPRNR